MIDFSKCIIDKTSNYGGSDQKRGIYYNGDRYMLKLSDRIDSSKNKSLNDSYSNSVFSEYICCNIIKLCGLDVQETLLGTIVMDTKKHKDRVVPVVACKNFIPENYDLIEFKNIANALLVEKPGRTPKLSEIYEILTNENVFFDNIDGKKALDMYCNTFIFDALFGNFDRHANNWGYLINKDTKELKLAPIYDCGSCLYPQLSDEAIPIIINNKDEIIKRIDTFPKAALLLDTGEKVSYKDFLLSANDDFRNALLRIYPKIDKIKINSFIDSINEISDIRKQFYKIMINERYNRILTPAYEKAIFQSQEQKNEDNDFEIDI